MSKLKERVGLFEIQGWGFLEVSAEDTWECGTARGVGVNIKDEAGGVMDLSEAQRLVDFLEDVIQRRRKK